MGFFSKLETATTASAAETQRQQAERLEELAGATLAPLAERDFRRVLSRERKRSERSKKNFVLMLIRETQATLQNGNTALLPVVAKALGCSIRDTDVLGWFVAASTLGVIFDELGGAPLQAAVESIEFKTRAVLGGVLTANQIATLEISFHSYPENWKGTDFPYTLNPVLFPDLENARERHRASFLVKRLIDIVGSAVALLLLTPLFACLALLIKLTSEGSVFFRQERLGQYEIPFVFLKFRSMYVSTSHDLHREYVQNYIAGRAEAVIVDRRKNERSKAVYKIAHDPRVTWIGRFMRRTSLDELPQFWNVLKGDMSLVGPRPPIPYEIEAYDLWHRRRLLEAKPGITGLWQVHGRSRTTFDEMVRLDLRYSRNFSLLSDLKILLQTPRAVISGNGAY